FADRAEHLGRGVAEGVHADPRGEVEVTAAVFREEPGALARDEEDVRLLVDPQQRRRRRGCDGASLSRVLLHETTPAPRAGTTPVPAPASVRSVPSPMRPSTPARAASSACFTFTAMPPVTTSRSSSPAASSAVIRPTAAPSTSTPGT